MSAFLQCHHHGVESVAFMTEWLFVDAGFLGSGEYETSPAVGTESP